jgi:predicted metal-dependent phosphoesterase TrpH
MIDLHTHTNCSDGEYSPRHLIDFASSRGITVMSISDHDTIMAYKTDIIDYAKKLGILLIPGIEFSTIDEQSKEKIHVLGLNVDINNNELKTICDNLYESRRNLVIQTEQKLSELGIILRAQELLKLSTVITKNHIASDVITNPDNMIILKKTYGRIPLYGTFIEDYLIKGKPAYIYNHDRALTSEAVRIIKQAGGKAICAHPSFNVMRGFDFGLMKQLILRNKFDGVEAINVQYDKSNGDAKFDMVAQFIDFADQNGLLISGGSDFHTNDATLLGNHSDIGLINENYKITEQMVANIIE